MIVASPEGPESSDEALLWALLVVAWLALFAAACDTYDAMETAPEDYPVAAGKED
ncbi:MAG: hypothetical protein AAGH15_05175 [Myxococcota bacterium]